MAINIEQDEEMRRQARRKNKAKVSRKATEERQRWRNRAQKTERERQS